jgi:DNA-directed RNA polymerase III subunit RPC6
MQLSDRQLELLKSLRNAPSQTLDADNLLKELEYWTMNEIMQEINALSGTFIQVLTVKGKPVFKALDDDEVEKTLGMSESERIIYNIIKSANNKGIWIKDIKSKSNLHTQLVNSNIKALEKKGIIKSVKSVKTPTKKVYMLTELEPSIELTGGAWYTDQELDVEFIDQLSNQLYKFIASKSFPLDSKDAIYPANYKGYPTIEVLHKWIRKSGITSIELSFEDVACLLDRLVYDGKVVKLERQDFSHTMDEDSEDETRKDMSHLMWMFKATKYIRDNGNSYSDIPCGSCPVFEFCKQGGPVNPEECVYLSSWLAQDF